MGAVYEDLEGHEGYAVRRLPDGTMTSSWTIETAAFGSYVAACECGWRGSDHAPTVVGYEEALEEWDRRHAQPLVAHAVPDKVKVMVREMKQVLAHLVDGRPAAGLKAVQEVEQWAKAVGRGAPSADSRSHQLIETPHSTCEDLRLRCDCYSCPYSRPEGPVPIP